MCLIGYVELILCVEIALQVRLACISVYNPVPHVTPRPDETHTSTGFRDFSTPPHTHTH